MNETGTYFESEANMQSLARSLDNTGGLFVIVGACIAVLAIFAAIFLLCGKKDRIGTLLMELFFIEISGVAIFMALGLEEIEGSESSSKLMPLLWAVPLLFVSVFQFFRHWNAESVKAIKHGRFDKVFFTFAVACLAISQFRFLGFFLSTSIMLVLMMLLLGERRVLLIFSTALFWGLFAWFVFNKVLLLNLPAGTLFTSLFA